MTLKPFFACCVSTLLLAGCGSVTSSQASLPVAVNMPTSGIAPQGRPVDPQVTGAIGSAATAGAGALALPSAGKVDAAAEAELQQALASAHPDSVAGSQQQMAKEDGEQTVAEQLRLRAAMNSGALGHAEALPEDN